MSESGRFVEPGRNAAIAVVIVTYNSAEMVEALLSDLRRDALSLALRVVVVDNESSDGTAGVVAGHDDVTLIRSGGNLGYAGGINRGRPHVAPCGAVLILNPDVRMSEGALSTMLRALSPPEVGAVVPRMIDPEEREVILTDRREPTVLGALGDALLGGRRFATRPRWLAETELRPERYQTPHAVDWATGAAMLIRAGVEQAVGDWDESYFLYSEETDYCHRIRDSGHQVWFEPTAVVETKGGGSGVSPGQLSLLAVNRVRYVERYRGKPYAWCYRWVAALGSAVRAQDPVHRHALWTLLRRDRWRLLPRATVSSTTAPDSGI